MKRRNFLGTVAGATALAAGSKRCPPKCDSMPGDGKFTEFQLWIRNLRDALDKFKVEGDDVLLKKNEIELLKKFEAKVGTLNKDLKSLCELAERVQKNIPIKKGEKSKEDLLLLTKLCCKTYCDYGRAMLMPRGCHSSDLQN